MIEWKYIHVEGLLKSAAVGEFGRGQSAVQLQELGAPTITSA